MSRLEGHAGRLCAGMEGDFFDQVEGEKTGKGELYQHPVEQQSRKSQVPSQRPVAGSAPGPPEEEQVAGRMEGDSGGEGCGRWQSPGRGAPMGQARM